jgi:Fe-Mn family superoxide dismutase
MMRPRLRIPLRPRLVTTTPARSTLLPLACQSRSLHAIAPLDYNLKNEASENGIPEFLSREAFNISWTRYQTHLLERLNALTGGMFFCSCFF